MLSSPVNATTIDVNGQPLKWEFRNAPMTITYMFLQNNFEIPKGKTIISQNNCKAMQAFDKINLTTSSLPLDLIKTQLDSAFKAWENAANITFQEVKSSDIADIVFGAEREDLNPAYTNISHTENEINQTYICMNSYRQWKIGFDGNFSIFDLRHTFMHEIGHALGLDHPNSSGNIMSYRYDEKVKELQPNDIQAVQKLYGPPRKH